VVVALVAVALVAVALVAVASDSTLVLSSELVKRKEGKNNIIPNIINT
jgi:hypothetical protein